MLEMDERERLLKNLGDCDVMLLRNHGALAVGRTVAEGFNNLYRLERPAVAQLLAQGGERRDHPALAGGAGENQPHVPPRRAPRRTACWNGRRCGASPTASILPTRTEMKRLVFLLRHVFFPAGQCASYPAKPLRIIVPFAPGGSTDIFARLVAERLSAALGQPVVVENRAGASGNIGADAVAQVARRRLHAADGDHRRDGDQQRAVQEHDLRRGEGPRAGDFHRLDHQRADRCRPICRRRTSPSWSRWRRRSPASSPSPPRARAARRTCRPSCSRAWPASTWCTCPYKGSGQALIDVVAGRVSMIFDNMPSALPHIKGGKLRALGVTGSKRSGALPEVPTIAESGVPGYESLSWSGFAVPAGTPRDDRAAPEPRNRRDPRRARHAAEARRAGRRRHRRPARGLRRARARASARSGRGWCASNNIVVN